MGIVLLPDGSRKTVSDESYRKALKKLDDLKADIRAGKIASGPDETLADYLASWLRDVVAPNKAPKAVTSYESVVRIHIAPALGKTKMRDLDAQAVQRWVTDLGKHLAPSTVAVCRAILVGALNKAVAWRLATYNPAASRAGCPSNWTSLWRSTR